jgi:predicted nucleic acid-binding protein
MTLLDTSALVGSLTGEGGSYPLLERVFASEARVAVSALVLFEWKRGPRKEAELAAQEDLFPSAQALPFGPAEAEIAAAIYRRLKRSRGREIDIAIAATAIAHGARLWTLNPKDFADIPGLKLARP